MRTAIEVFVGVVLSVGAGIAVVILGLRIVDRFPSSPVTEGATLAIAALAILVTVVGAVFLAVGAFRRRRERTDPSSLFRRGGR